MSKFLNENKVIREFWNTKEIFKAKGWQKRNISMPNYWDRSLIISSNVVTKKKHTMLKEVNEVSYDLSHHSLESKSSYIKF